MSCVLGDLVDLSAGGMQVVCDGRPVVGRGDVRRFTILTAGERIEVTGSIAWVRRVTRDEYRVGVCFQGTSPGTEAALEHLARFGFIGGPARVPGAARASVEVEDLYRILGVAPEASADEIHSAYRALARAFHPDVCKDPEAGAQFALIAKAYGVLKDPQQRRRYDRLLARCA